MPDFLKKVDGDYLLKVDGDKIKLMTWIAAAAWWFYGLLRRQ